MSSDKQENQSFFFVLNNDASAQTLSITYNGSLESRIALNRLHVTRVFDDSVISIKYTKPDEIKNKSVSIVNKFMEYMICTKVKNYLFSDDHFKIIVNDEAYLLSACLKTFPESSICVQILQLLIDHYNPWFIINNPQISLLMRIDDDELSSLYKFDKNGQISSGENCGINLLIPCTQTIKANGRSVPIDFKVCAEGHPNYGYLLMPRSSIAKTAKDTLRQSNSIGLIESTYRGNIIFKVDNISEEDITKNVGESISQLVMPMLKTNWKIQKVLRLSTTARGTGGFGSTGK